MIAFYFLGGASVALALRHAKVASALVGAAVAIAYYAGQIEGLGILSLISLIGALWLAVFFRGKKWIRQAAGACTVALTIGLYLHWLPGFHNLLVLDSVRLSQSSIPFTLYLNFDKTLAGLALWFFAESLRSTARFRIKDLNETAPIALTACLSLLFISYAAKYVSWDPKWPSFFWVWSLNNLLFVCVSEEILFRGWLQGRLAAFLGRWTSLLVGALLFGLLHFKGGLAYVALATVAGCFYGYAFERSKRIESSVIVHFMVNVIHFVLFSYPALQR